ncbi:PREDICTED: protein NUCLEAR FUSION DEFECTIVE 6, chloroplastic/mitochondrial-like isoform X1 [Nicotiana attenuata]|uniref:protein NUCLEAR FUSION DEFECTIVE 6, chloroplastic/mitochondrial-like isoform X1 n=1 Tax=Nicotiana attenuata TaxID=49451 RepID=UPI000905D2B9|nr:PREDICTED: protein NUCLEAR FUSION DEFECTIVE 6, chloroplastic/mitochondrial-like isoform X1 [Nicotiana attenuata]
MATFAARSVLRSATTSGRAAAARLASGAKPKSSPFRIPTQKPLTARIFRSPVEMSSVRVESMFPYHTATASALLTSMLSATPRSYGWTLEAESCFCFATPNIIVREKTWRETKRYYGFKNASKGKTCN